MLSGGSSGAHWPNRRMWERPTPAERPQPEDRNPPPPPPRRAALRVVHTLERDKATEALLKAARTVVEEWQMGYVTEYAVDELDGAINDMEAR